ncbi:hypothetical protein SASPL_119575 [Salvia splendens]|uniref:CG-1 domain-containing protein n=1 Tax=Salvia splendens TaxID=180675 RepID=A0A8X8ZUE3_SALSN|nr:hypothetical protein SASPL_119575 [Salvia splendens]
MAESGSYNLGFLLDIKQILSEAQNRWLRPAEICEILRNHEKFHISPEAPNKPVSGSVFLFNRKILRYFRKDAHNWRKKKDGKTVKEAHEKLKVGSVDMLNCYYAHGEDDENFQRRSYWLLETDLMHIVFVHYLEVKGNKTNNSYARNSDRVVPNSENESSLTSIFRGTSPTSTLSSAYEDAESGETAYGQESQCFLPAQDNWQVLNALLDQKSLPSDQGEQSGQRNIQMFLSDTDTGNATNSNMEDGMTLTGSESYSFHLRKPLINGLQTEDSLKKVDSFSRWIAKEIGEGGDLDMQSSNGLSWSSMGSEYDPIMSAQLQVDTHTLNPSVSQDQLFTIIDFSPSWAYSTLDTKVLLSVIKLPQKYGHVINGTSWTYAWTSKEIKSSLLENFLQAVKSFLDTDGPLCLEKWRLACSELREFEYRSGPDQIIGSINLSGDNAIMMHLYQRFEMILHREPVGSPIHSGGNEFERLSVTNKIISMMEENDLEAELSENDGAHLKVIGEMLLKKHLKEKFYSWLLSRAADDGKGLTMIDERGQNVLHLAAALGFDWAIQPIIVSGVSIDFRDVNGFTALHWAAAYGREDVVAVLVSLGASPGPLTDPSAEYPLGRTPADLASSSGHKGISGFLAETSLTSHLSTLRVNDGGTAEVSAFEPIQTVSERLAVPRTGADVPDTLSLKDSLAAVCNATQAAARIHQIFRIQSFQRKKLIDQESDDELLTPDAISLVAAKTSRLGHSDGMANTAALQIQKKYRGLSTNVLIAHVRGHQVRKKYKPIIWSVGILEKVILRWRRKRSGLRGFRSDAVQKEPDAQCSLPLPVPVPEDDYDVLKEGRKQTEERMQKALARVQSMAQNPEGRAQYRRLLTAAEGFRENQDGSDMSSMFPEMMSADEDLLDISSLLDDDTFMSLAFE